MTHTHIDLFSGIGGFSLAFESEGFKTIAYSEINPDKILVYEHHFPGVPNLGDIKLIQVSDIRSAHGPVDVITGGVPCTPASSLGQMRGALDERWLWPETIRLVGQIRPRFGLFENPPSLIALNRGREWNGILSGFCALGYDCWWDVFPSAAFGAGHLRERVLLVVADAQGQSKSSPHDGHPNRVIGDKLRLPQPSHGDQENNASNASERGRQERSGLCEGQPTRERSGRSGDTLGETPTNPNLSGLQGHPWHGTHSHGRAQQRRPVATPDLSESPANHDRQAGPVISGGSGGERSESLQHNTARHRIPDLRGRVNSHNWWHEANSGVPVLAHGLPARLVEAAARCAGDSVVPQVIQPIAKAIKSALTPFSEE